MDIPLLQSVTARKGVITSITRMVQLPATAAIEYVAAGHFFPGGLLAEGIFVRGCFCPGGLMPVPPSSMRIRPVYTFCAQRDGQTNKKQTNSAPQLRGEQTPAPQIFRVCRGGGTLYIFHPSTVWVRPLFTDLGLKKTQKADFAMKQTNIMSPQRRHNEKRPKTVVIPGKPQNSIQCRPKPAMYRLSASFSSAMQTVMSPSLCSVYMAAIPCQYTPTDASINHR